MSSDRPYYVPYRYTWSAARPTVTRVSTSRTEIVQILIAYVVITVDLTVIFFGGGVLSGGHGIASLLSGTAVLVAAVAALTGFVCHELAHKVYAQRHGFWAEFRMSLFGLAFSLVTSLLAGILWAVPGATVVSGMSDVDRENWGRTSLAGPASNATFALVFFAGAFGAFLAHSWVASLLVFVAWVNGWFGTFNLIPFGPLDGAKVYRWRKSVWLAALLLVGAFTALLTLIFAGYLTPLLGH